MKWHVEHVQEVDSTNSALLRVVELALEAGRTLRPLRGRVLWADRQTSGRGQHGRTWISPPGGLYWSAILGDVRPELRPLTPLLVGAAVAQALEQEGFAKAALRWPNDVVIDGKKVAGVLCEGVAVGENWIGVAGVGINVNTPLSALSAELSERATTLWAQDGQPRDLPTLLHAILKRLAALLASTPERAVDAVRQRDALLGHHITVQDPAGSSTGVAAGLDRHGALLLTTPAGREAVANATVLAIDGVPIR